MFFRNSSPLHTVFPSLEKTFHLLRRFSVASVLIIAVIAVVNGVLLSNLLTSRLIEREANLSRDFVQQVLLTDGSLNFLSEPNNPGSATLFENSIQHFTSIPDVVLVNIYSPDRVVLWSSERKIIGQTYSHNHNLETALAGSLVFQEVNPADWTNSLPENVGLRSASSIFFEIYIPVWNPTKAKLIAVLELYKGSATLKQAVRAGQYQIWLTALVGAVALYFTLYWIVRISDRNMKEQHRRILKAETMAAVGEMASSVAHNIRNPLASIRSSAEVIQELHGPEIDEQASDIMSSVDRIEGWLRDMVSFGHVEHLSREQVNATRVLQLCFRGAQDKFRQNGIESEVHAQADLISVRADRALLGHVLQSLVTNAIEATPQGGRITGRITKQDRQVRITIADTGTGMAREQMDNLFGLFFSTKPRGMGIGLALAKRAVERFGGSIRAESTLGSGTVFIIELPEF